MSKNIGKCERCEDVEVELVATNWEQHFGLEEPTHCQDCADVLSQKAQEQAFEAYWRG